MGERDLSFFVWVLLDLPLEFVVDLLFFTPAREPETFGRRFIKDFNKINKSKKIQFSVASTLFGSFFYKTTATLVILITTLKIWQNQYLKVVTPRMFSGSFLVIS